MNSVTRVTEDKSKEMTLFMTDFYFLYLNVYFEFKVEISGGYRNKTCEHTYFFVEFFDTYKFDFFEMVARSTICGGSTRYVLTRLAPVLASWLGSQACPKPGRH